MLVAQISDIHASVQSANLEALDKALTWLAALAPDAVVITGDIVSDDWAAGYDTLLGQLSVLDCPAFALPGNSDDPVRMRKGLAPRMSWTNPAGPMHFTGAVGGVSLIGLDVTVSGENYGDALPHLAWLEAAMRDAPSAPLIFMHQPPILSGIDAMDAIRCRHSIELLQSLDAAYRPPLGICCGHVHRPVSGRLGSVPVSICGSICPSNPLLLGDGSMPPITDGPSLVVHEIVAGNLRTHTVTFAT